MSAKDQSSNGGLRDSVLATPPTGVPPRVASLMLNFARARLLQRQFRKEDNQLKRAEEQSDNAEAELTLPSLFPLWTYFNLWLAYLHVVVEGWDKSLLHDERIYDLLKDGFREQLKGFRNAVFHAEDWNDRRILVLYRQHRQVTAWANELMNAMEKYFITFLRP